MRLNKMVTFSDLSRFYLCCILKDNSLLVLPAKMFLIRKMEWRWMHLCANDVNDGCLATDEGTTGDRIALRRSWVPFLPGTLKIFWVVPRDVENLFARRPGSKLFSKLPEFLWKSDSNILEDTYWPTTSRKAGYTHGSFTHSLATLAAWNSDGYMAVYWNLKCPAIFVKGLVRTFLSSPIKMCYMHNVHTFRC